MYQKVWGIVVMVRMLRLVIKVAKQTIVKWQENRASSRQTSESGHNNSENFPVLRLSVSCNIITGWNCKYTLWCCVWHRGTEERCFITLWWTVSEIPVYFYMPSSYIIGDNVGAESLVIKTSGSEKMWVTNVDWVSRQCETITMCDSKLKITISKAQLLVRLVIMSHLMNWRRGLGQFVSHYLEQGTNSILEKDIKQLSPKWPMVGGCFLASWVW
jgi:hypothetical protein